MSSSSALVTISPDSLVIVFSGNLLKAPPLNRRGRKKWHERYFLLRANKTIEIHKSRRAAEAQKTPRRVIDLRECISLELGLEYKNLQHILSLGTFKRTFFLAAPSDALMLQWGNVLEKVKGAVSGETIEVLDIGLRNTRNFNAVHRVKPSEPTRAFSSAPTSPRKIWGRLYPKGASKSSYAVSGLGKDAMYHRGSGNVGYTSYYTSPNNRSSSLSNQESYGRDDGQETFAYGHPKMADTSIETVDLRERGRLSRASSSTSSSGPSPLHPPLSGGKIPPPNMLKGWRGSQNGGSPKHGEDGSLHHEEEMQREDGRWRRLNGRENGPRGEAILHRSEAFRSVGSKQGAAATNGDMGGGWRGRRVSEDSMSKRRVQNEGSASPTPSIPLKHSRHYRKIELQAEKPLFGVREDDEGSSDEETDSVVSDNRRNPGVVPVTSFPGKSYHMLGRDHYPQPPLSVPARLELHGRRRNNSGPPISGRRSGGYGYPSARNRDRLELGGRGYFGGSGGNGWVGSESRHENISPFDDAGTELPPRPNFMNRPRPLAKEVATHKFYSLESLQRSLQEENSNNYCQVTVGDRNEDTASEITSSRTGISNAKLENIRSKSSVNSLEYDFQLPSPNTSSLCEEETREIHLSPPLSPLLDDSSGDLRLPARDSESYLYRSSGSMKSPIDEILAPPLSFDDIHQTPQSIVVNETISEEAEPQTSESDQVGRGSRGFKSSAVATDRNSTESGYTSGQGQSPGVNDRRNLKTVEEFIPLPNGTMSEVDVHDQSMENGSNSDESAQDVLSDLSVSSMKNSLSGYSVRNSQTSYASTDSIRCYVPLVFQKSGKAQREDSSSLLVVVCLVENSDTLIKDLLSQKVAGGYRAVECEGEVGKNVVNAGDDFTVETALEDLEFGFSITTSKQRDVYINRAKVREFQFKIDNLFGCSGKPFSCDVEIRHADQMTVLPIEIECAD